MIAQAAASGLGVALVPRFFVEREVQSGDIEILFDIPLRYPHAYYIAVPKKKRSDKVIAAFITWIATEIP